jgi:inorganic pyrophosphatase
MARFNLWHDLIPGPKPPDTIYVVVETPKTSRNKYEYNKDVANVELDRVLYSPLHYPGDYGFIPQTYAGDGDPLDVLVMTNQPTFPGCIITARPLGMFKMVDKGEEDYKILAVPAKDPNFDDYWDISNVPRHFPREVEHFFMVYKDLEGTKVTNEGWVGVNGARDAILESIEFYRKEFGMPDQRRLISTNTPWETLYGYSRGVRIGETIHISGTTAWNSEGKVIGQGDAAAQTRQVLQNISDALEKAGGSLADVVRTRMYVVRREDADTVAKVHGEFFKDIRPASTLVLVAGLIDEDMLVEIEAEAFVNTR